MAHNNNSSSADLKIFAGKTPPQNLEAERFVLGAFLQDNDAVVEFLHELSSDDFYLERHRIIHRAMVGLEAENKPVDMVTILAKLSEKEEIEKAGGQDYLIELIDGVASSANLAWHIELIKEKAVLRRIVHKCSDIITTAMDPATSREDALNKAESEVFSLSEIQDSSTARAAREILAETMKAIESYQSGRVVGVPTGFQRLDELTCGLQAADFVVLAGRPGMGKTAFALSLLGNTAINHRKKVVFFSLEMGAEQLMQRVLCSRASIDMHRLRQGKLTSEEFSRIHYNTAPIADSPIFIDDHPGLNLPQLRSKCRNLKKTQGLDLIIIDYLQLMDGEKGIENRNQEISKISRGIKMLAKELKLPVIALSQLSRKTEDRPGASKEPQLSDLRDSGAIEQDADMVWFVHREDYYRRNRDEEGEFGEQASPQNFLIVAKHRNGPTDKIPVTFVKESASFHDYSDRVEEFQDYSGGEDF